MRLLNPDNLSLGAKPTPDQALQSFRRLTDFADSFLTQGWLAEEVFWSRYFWFSVFVRLETALKGPDAGLEQQAFKLLDSPFPECLPDWSELEKIDARLKEV